MTIAELRAAIDQADREVVQAQHGMRVDRERIADLTVSLATNTRRYDGSCARHSALTKQLQEAQRECQILPFAPPGPVSS